MHYTTQNCESRQCLEEEEEGGRGREKIHKKNVGENIGEPRKWDNNDDYNDNGEKKKKKSGRSEREKCE
jgi:hypothetical protein